MRIVAGCPILAISLRCRGLQLVPGDQMVDPHIQFRQSRYFPSLDGLRAISILAVVWHHSGFHGSGIFLAVTSAWQLFFAISGFLITTLLLRERESTGHINLKIFTFAVR